MVFALISAPFFIRSFAISGGLYLAANINGVRPSLPFALTFAPSFIIIFIALIFLFSIDDFGISELDEAVLILVIKRIRIISDILVFIFLK